MQKLFGIALPNTFATESAVYLVYTKKHLQNKHTSCRDIYVFTFLIISNFRNTRLVSIAVSLLYNTCLSTKVFLMQCHFE